MPKILGADMLPLIRNKIPTSTSELDNDSNFVNKEALTTELSAKQDTLVSGTNIKTFNGSSLLGGGNIYNT